MSGPILVASDGSRGSEGALRTGLALAREQGRDVEVVAVLQPFPRYPVGGLAPFPEGYALYETIQAESLKLAVSEQLRGLGDDAAGWPMSVEVGSPAATIARHAHERGAGLIVVGAGQRVPLDRWLGNETALKVVRLECRQPERRDPVGKGRPRVTHPRPPGVLPARSLPGPRSGT